MISFLCQFFPTSAVTEMYGTQKEEFGILNFRVKTERLIYSVSPHRMIGKQQCMPRYLNFVTKNKANLTRSSPCEIHLAYRSFFKKKFLISLSHFLTLE